MSKSRGIVLFDLDGEVVKICKIGSSRKPTRKSIAFAKKFLSILEAKSELKAFTDSISIPSYPEAHVVISENDLNDLRYSPKNDNWVSPSHTLNFCVIASDQYLKIRKYYSAHKEWLDNMRVLQQINLCRFSNVTYTDVAELSEMLNDVLSEVPVVTYAMIESER